MKLHFYKNFFLLTVIIFIIEILIAFFVKDTLIRPFIGDVLVVILIYCSLNIFFNFSHFKTAFAVFCFACLIEILQYFDYVKLLGLENNRAISVILGRTFEWLDFIAYFIGFLLILFFEKIRQNKNL